MEVDTISGRIHVHNQQQLAAAFRERRQGAFAAFDLFLPQPYPWLSVLINGSLAYLHYFPAEGHPGFQSWASAAPASAATDQTVHFLQSSGSEADSFDLPRSTVVPAELALLAAQQFFGAPGLPTCIPWREL